MQASDAKRDSKLLQRVMGTLNEAQRRWLVGREALRCGRGGIQRMVETSGLSKPTILKGIRELSGKSKLVAEEGRVRKQLHFVAQLAELPDQFVLVLSHRRRIGSNSPLLISLGWRAD